ncbi:MAG TPA: TonB family protein [Bacteroidia bacterium]|nr:TonB family protein [Bacteroidia bacterium]
MEKGENKCTVPNEVKRIHLKSKFLKMKKTVVTIYLLVVTFLCFAQDTLKVKDPNADKIFTIVENMPQFPGGKDALEKYIHTNLKYPAETRNKGIEGNVYVTFTLDTLGKPFDVKLLRGLETSLDQEAISLIKNMPNWSPGSQNGHKVKMQYNQQIKFSLSNYITSNYENGIDFYNKEKYKKAISSFTKSIDENKNIVDSYYQRGVCQNKLGNAKEACDDWKKAKELGDTKVEAVLEKYCK